MTDWVTLTEAELGADKILTSPTVTALYENVLAMAEGAAGAPQLQTAAIAALAVTGAKIAADAIDQANLSTSLGEVSVQSPSTYFNVALPGGEYGFFPQTKQTNASFGQVANARLGVTFSGTGYVTRIALHGDINQGQTSIVWAQQRYFNASPPFDLGDGEVHGFIFVLLQRGEVAASYAADVPPWAYNGPTSLRPDVVDRAGKKYKRRPRSRLVLDMLEQDRITLPEALERCRSPEYQGFDLIEISHEMKNRDMAAIPHPFHPTGPGDVVVLIDPLNERVGSLMEMQRQGGSVIELLRQAKFRFGHGPLKRRGPPDVIQVPMEL